MKPAAAPAAIALQCSICSVVITRREDAKKISAHGKVTDRVRCTNYDACILRAVANRHADS